MTASSCAAGCISGNAVASRTVVTDDCPAWILLVSLGLTRGSVVAVTVTESVGVGRTDSGIGEGCVDCGVGSILLLFEAGSFCNFCGNLPALCFFLGRRCDGSVCSRGTPSGIGSVVGGMGTEVVGETGVARNWRLNRLLLLQFWLTDFGLYRLFFMPFFPWQRSLGTFLSSFFLSVLRTLGRKQHCQPSGNDGFHHLPFLLYSGQLLP